MLRHNFAAPHPQSTQTHQHMKVIETTGCHKFTLNYFLIIKHRNFQTNSLAPQRARVSISCRRNPQ